MMNKSTILHYAAGFLLPAIVMYGTGYNGTADALILTVIWILLIASIFALILVVFAGVALAAIGIGDTVEPDLRTKMEKAREQQRLWPVAVVSAIWMLVALSSVAWTGTAITYFVIWLLIQIASRLFVNTFTSMEAKLDASNAN